MEIDSETLGVVDRDSGRHTGSIRVGMRRLVVDVVVLLVSVFESIPNELWSKLLAQPKLLEALGSLHGHHKPVWFFVEQVVIQDDLARKRIDSEGRWG